jgi:hypothetical protein
MENNELIDLFIFFQILSFLMIYLEKDYIFSDEWKKLSVKTKIGRVFMIHLPILVVISLFINPIS